MGFGHGNVTERISQAFPVQNNPFLMLVRIISCIPCKISENIFENICDCNSACFKFFPNIHNSEELQEQFEPTEDWHWMGQCGDY